MTECVLQGFRHRRFVFQCSSVSGGDTCKRSLEEMPSEGIKEPLLRPMSSLESELS
jgi:hypothetical protein